jgi:hypothetical protein
VFFLLFGSSAFGKTFALAELRGRVSNVAVHDFDEIGVPPGADGVWRHRANEQWVQRALGYETDGTDMLLAGQTPLGELLATPSASRLGSISACLLDCDDATRVARLRARGQGWSDQATGEVDDYLDWAAWMRRHAVDPTWRTDVIRHPATDGEMHWSRWVGWQAGDPRWRVHVIDTTAWPVREVGSEVRNWIENERALVRAGAHPLAGDALARPDDAMA